MEAFVTKLATLPTSWPSHATSRFQHLIALREALLKTAMPPQIATIVVRFASRALGPEEPRPNMAWSTFEVWDEESLQELCALLFDALAGDFEGAVAATKTLKSRYASIGTVLTRESAATTMARESAEVAVPWLSSNVSKDYHKEVPHFAGQVLPNVLAHSSPLQDDLPAIRDAFETSKSSHLAVAHIIHFLISLAEHERSITLRRASLLSLSALSCALPSNLLASFLPGVTSRLVHLLAACRLDQASIVVAALHALVAMVLRTFHNEMNYPTQKANLSKQRAAPSFSETLASLDEAPCESAGGSTGLDDNSILKSNRVESFREGERSLLRVRDTRWVTENSREISARLCFILESRDGVISHGSVRTRLAMLRFARILIASTSGYHLEERVQSLLGIVLFDGCGDLYSVVQDAAVVAVISLKEAGRLSLCLVEGGFKAAAIIASKGKSHKTDTDGGLIEESDSQTTGLFEGMAMSGREGQIEEETVLRFLKHRDYSDVIRLCYGYLRVLVPLPDRQGWWNVDRKDNPKQLVFHQLACSVARLGVEIFCRMLLKLLEESWSEAAAPFGKTLPEVESQILEIAYMLGQAGLDALLFPCLYSFGSRGEDEIAGYWQESNKSMGRGALHSSFKSRSYALIILLSVVRGAISRSVNEVDAERHLRQVSQTAKELLYELTFFSLPSQDNDALASPGFVDDITVSLKRCLLRCTGLLIKDLSSVHQERLARPMSSGVVAIILLSMLKDASCTEESVRSDARCILNDIAKTMHCSDERMLILRHLNFVMSRMVRSFEAPWAGDVLGFIIADGDDELSREATSLLQQSVRELCDNLAGEGDSRVMRSLAAIGKILRAAVKQSRATAPGACDGALGRETNGDIQAVSSEEDVRRLHRKLLHYCTDDVSDDEALGTEDAQADCNDDLRSVDDDFETPRNSFEAVAQDMLVGVQDLLVGRPWNIRAAALSCATEAVYLLESNETLLLPHAAKLLPLLPDQFAALHRNQTASERLLDRIKQRKIMGREDADEIEDLVKYLNSKGAELPVVRNACRLLTALAQCAGSFIRDRFITLIFPKMRPLLRLASCFPSLLGCPLEARTGAVFSPPSYGAMSAADACLEALAAMARLQPMTLAPHSKTLIKHIVVYLQESERKKHARAYVGHSNRSMLQYERERWEKRVKWAETIVRSQTQVNPGAVTVGLLVYDGTIGTVRPPNEMLHKLTIANK